MKITKEELSEILEIIGQAEAFRPIVKQVLDTLKSFSGELREIPEAVGKWLVNNRINSIRQYEEAGFDRDDAIVMTLDDVFAVRKILDKHNKNNNKQA